MIGAANISRPPRFLQRMNILSQRREHYVIAPPKAPRDRTGFLASPVIFGGPLRRVDRLSPSLDTSRALLSKLFDVQCTLFTLSLLSSCPGVPNRAPTSQVLSSSYSRNPVTGDKYRVDRIRNRTIPSISIVPWGPARRLQRGSAAGSEFTTGVSALEYFAHGFH